MLNLEKSIADWRKQMLAAGIKTPVPLEELENHLREEIERQLQSGINDEQAFETAVQAIGPASALVGEFKKVDAARNERSRALDKKVISISLVIQGVLVPLTMSSMMLFKTGELSQITSGEQMSGLVAAATFTLFAWGGRLGYRLFPVIRAERYKAIAMGLIAVPVVVWWFVFYNLILPCHEFTMGPLILAIYWGFLAPAGPLMGWMWGIETAARKKGAMAVS